MQSSTGGPLLQDEWQTTADPSPAGYFTEDLITLPNFNYDMIEMSTKKTYWYISLLIWTAVCFFGIFGNLLVIISFIRFPYIRTLTNYLICNLAVSDIVSGIGGVLYAFTNYTTIGLELVLYQRYACLIPMAVFTASLMTSVTGILVISIERLIAVLAPLRHLTLVTKRRILSIIVGVWVVLFITIVTPTAGFNEWKPGKGCDYSTVFPHLYMVIFILSLLFIIMIIVTIANIIIACFAFRRFRKFPKEININSSAQLKQLMMQYKVTRMLLTVVGCFYVCWLPMSTMSIYTMVNKPSWLGTFVDEVKRDVVSGLFIANTVINPIIYASQNERFYKAFKAILRCKVKPQGNQMQSKKCMVTDSSCK